MPLLLPALTLWLSLYYPNPLPDVADLDGFPSEHECDDMVAWLRIRRDWLDAQVQLHGDDHYYAALYQPAIEDNAYRLNAWTTLDAAQTERRWAAACEYEGRYQDGTRVETAEAHHLHEAREALADLRRAIGPREYELRRLPGPIDPRFLRR